MYVGYLHSPIGYLHICADDEGITALDFCENKGKEEENQHVKECKRELLEYFDGRRQEFQVPIHLLKGTPFQRRCWEELCKIPYGETRSYHEQAIAVGNGKAVRAVGGANHHNPISIIIPCHRVIAKNGSLSGYGGGVIRKQFLLDVEMGEDD